MTGSPLLRPISLLRRRGDTAKPERSRTHSIGSFLCCSTLRLPLEGRTLRTPSLDPRMPGKKASTQGCRVKRARTGVSKLINNGILTMTGMRQSGTRNHDHKMYTGGTPTWSRMYTWNAHLVFSGAHLYDGMYTCRHIWMTGMRLQSGRAHCVHRRPNAAKPTRSGIVGEGNFSAPLATPPPDGYQNHAR